MSYLSLEALAITLNLPKAYLRRLAVNKQIPCLDAGGRMRFNPQAAQNALDKLAETGEGQ